jgi:hypothetical protein
VRDAEDQRADDTLVLDRFDAVEVDGEEAISLSASSFLRLPFVL